MRALGTAAANATGEGEVVAGIARVVEEEEVVAVGGAPIEVVAQVEGEGRGTRRGALNVRRIWDEAPTRKLRRLPSSTQLTKQAGWIKTSESR